MAHFFLIILIELRIKVVPVLWTSKLLLTQRIWEKQLKKDKNVWLTEWTESRAQGIHNEDTRTSLLSACDDPERISREEGPWQVRQLFSPARARRRGRARARSYRGDAVGHVVLAGDAQQFVLWQLEAAEGTRSSLILQLRCVRASAALVWCRAGQRGWGETHVHLYTDPHSTKNSGDVLGPHRTMASIFFLYFGSIWFRYSGLISRAAKPKAEFFSPARWHSMTADVKIGITSAESTRGRVRLDRAEGGTERRSLWTHELETCWCCCWREWACVPL